MMRRLVGSCLCAAMVVVGNQALADTAPNSLESAYWRFEEGANTQIVNSAVANPVLDSTNQNHLDAFNTNTSPTYTNNVAPTPLKSGLANNLALDFIPHEGGGDDLFTIFSNGDFGKGLAKHINNGIISAGGGFTIEAAFNSNNPGRFAGILTKEGRPGGSRPEQTLALKTRGDNSLLQIEMWDGNGNLKQVSSLAPLNASQWYYVAVVNDGATMSMYLDSNNGQGYQLQGSIAVTGALYQAVPANPSWDNSWTVGRGQFAGNPADWFDGIIDEVRLSNTALPPSQFLFAPATATLAGDYNNSGKVDAADYVLWRNGSPLANETVTPGTATPEDYTVWRANFGNPVGSGLGAAAVPEPGTVALLAMVAAGCFLRRGAKTRCEMQHRNISRIRGGSWLLVVPVVSALAGTVAANTASNPLESTYWRFEEGAAFTSVDSTIADPVVDSINQNHLDAFDVNTAPTYTSEVPPTPLKSGLTNTLALDFIPNAGGGGDDLFTLYSDGDFGKGLAKHINNGVIAAGSGFTVEGAFKTNNPARFAAIIGKEGQPAGSRPVQTFVIKTRGDNSKLQVELYDGNGTERQVSSINALSASQWYYFAAVSNGTTLSFYLDANNGQGYQLQGSVAANGALFQGVPANPLWDASWTVGRGQYGGNPADWFDGLIDEVRITNSALSPAQFLFAPTAAGNAVVPEPTAIALGGLAFVFWLGRRESR